MIYHHLYLWSEAAGIPPAADSLLERLVMDPSLPDVERLALGSIAEAFSRHFPGIATCVDGMSWRDAGGAFHASCVIDNEARPLCIRVSSDTDLMDTLDVLQRIQLVALELGCTRIESAVKPA